MESVNLLSQILSTDNSVRQRAEADMNTKRTQDPASLMQLFVENLKNSDPQTAQMACVLFKKYFLDNTEGFDPSNFEQMGTAVIESIDPSQPMVLLKSKGDLISKICMLQGKSDELLAMLQKWAQEDNSVFQQLAMYVSQKQTECHLTVDQLKAYTERYFAIFQKCLGGSDLKVRVTSIPAITSFLLSAKDDDDKNAV